MNKSKNKTKILHVIVLALFGAALGVGAAFVQHAFRNILLGPTDAKLDKIIQLLEARP